MPTIVVIGDRQNSAATAAPPDERSCDGHFYGREISTLWLARQRMAVKLGRRDSQVGQGRAGLPVLLVVPVEHRLHDGRLQHRPPGVRRQHHRGWGQVKFTDRQGSRFLSALGSRIDVLIAAWFTAGP
jgi:hypothetical protein